MLKVEVIATNSLVKKEISIINDILSVYIIFALKRDKFVKDILKYHGIIALKNTKGQLFRKIECLILIEISNLNIDHSEQQNAIIQN